jgi:hypothetical protein
MQSLGLAEMPDSPGGEKGDSDSDSDNSTLVDPVKKLMEKSDGTSKRPKIEEL